jgi:hypothetical protein
MHRLPAYETGLRQPAPSIRAPAFDGHGKAGPYTGPDDEPQVKAKGAYFRVTRSSSGRRSTAGGDEDNLDLSA